MKAHKFADIFPMMNDREHKELKEDIQKNGLMETIIIHDGKILDGRNRYRVCKELGIEPKTEEYKGNDALQYVISTNLKRRHLTDNQRAVVGSRIADLEKGSNQHSPHGLSQEEVSKLMNIPVTAIKYVKQIEREKPEAIKEIEQGNIKIRQVIRQLDLEKQEKAVNELKGITGEYEVIVIDPPWRYDDYNSYDPDNRRGITPYPTMEVAEIRNIKIPSTENCVLLLWTTHKFIWDAKQILEHWGFEYKAIMVWDKEKIGIGKTLRMQCEFCLVGFKGKPLWKLTNQRDIIREARTTHSTKPEIFYKMVEEICVGRKLDYFARKERKGWDVYGNEVKGGENQKV